ELVSDGGAEGGAGAVASRAGGPESGGANGRGDSFSSDPAATGAHGDNSQVTIPSGDHPTPSRSDGGSANTPVTRGPSSGREESGLAPNAGGDTNSAPRAGNQTSSGAGSPAENAGRAAIQRNPASNAGRDAGQKTSSSGG